MRRLTLTVPEARDGCKAETLLRRELALSAAAVRRAKARPDGITLNGAPVFTTARVRAGQVLSVLVGDVSPAGGDNGLPIVCADQDVIVLDKPAPMSTMRSPGKPGPTVEELMTRDGEPFRPVGARIRSA